MVFTARRPCGLSLPTDSARLTWPAVCGSGAAIGMIAVSTHSLHNPALPSTLAGWIAATIHSVLCCHSAYSAAARSWAATVIVLDSDRALGMDVVRTRGCRTSGSVVRHRLCRQKREGHEDTLSEVRSSNCSFSSCGCTVRGCGSLSCRDSFSGSAQRRSLGVLERFDFQACDILVRPKGLEPRIGRLCAGAERDVRQRRQVVVRTAGLRAGRVCLRPDFTRWRHSITSGSRSFRIASVLTANGHS